MALRITRYDPLQAFRGCCRSCKADVLWAVTQAGERMPVNAKPSTAGNVMLTIMPGHANRPDRLVAGVLNRQQAAGARDRGVQLHTSHFVDCPRAAEHRRRRNRRP